MHHFFEAIQNKSGDALPGYQVKVLDSVTGDIEPIYSDNSGTPISTDSGIDDTAIVDDNGNVSFYVAQGTYDLAIYSPSGASQILRVPNIPMGLSTITTAAGASVATRALMAVIDSPVALQSAILTESGREGTFVFDDSDLSTEVALDTAQGIYVPPSTDTTGASGAWVRKYSGAANAKWFGAAIDGTTDDTAAHDTALALVDELYIPSGTSVVSAFNIPAGKTIRTDGFDTVIQRKSGTSDGTRILNINGSNVVIEDIAIKGNIASESGEHNHAVSIQANTATGSIRNVTIGNVKATDIRGDAAYVGSLATTAGTPTISIASPGVVTLNAHGLSNGTPVYFTTSGALPTGITAGATYYVVSAATNTFQIAASPNGAAINTSGSQSGTHTLHALDNTVSQVKIGQIYANNCWRNGLSVTDGVTGLEVESVHEVACGQQTVDIEPNGFATGPGIKIGTVRGRHLSFAGSVAPVTGVEVGTADMDLTYGANSTPANSYDHKMASQAAGTSNAVVIAGAVATIHRLKANGYSGSAVFGISGAANSRLHIGQCEISNCAQTDTTYATFLAGNSTVAISIDQLTATTDGAVTSQSVANTHTGLMVGYAKISLAPSTFYMRSCTDSQTRTLMLSAASGVGGTAILSGTRVHIYGGLQVGDRFFSFCTSCVAYGVNSTMNTGQDVSGTTNSFVASTRDGTFSHYANTTGDNWSGAGSINALGAVRSQGATSGIGYQSGSGGTVTQATSKSTGVTLNKANGAITLNNAALAAGAKVSFVVTNSAVAANDTVIASVRSGGTANAYRADVTATAAGSFTVTVENITAGSLSEAPVIGFAVIKGVTS